MAEAQGWRCTLCGEPIDGTGRTCIAEHWRQVAMGNDQKPDCLLCKACAHRKSYGTPATSYGSDAHARAKEDRITGKTKTGPVKKIPSHKLEGQGFQSKPEGYKYPWPSRPMKREARR